MKIALIQQHATKDRIQNVERGIKAFQDAVAAGAELIAYAELGLSYFLPQNPATSESVAKAERIPGPVIEKFQKLAALYGVVTVLNVFEKAGDKTFDSSPVIDSDGKLLGVTRMAHVMDGLGFYEKGYYTPGDNERFVYDTKIGKVGIAICYDRHFPEYMRNLALQGAEIVVVPQAGALGEWTEGLFEAELQVAAFQNGYFAALVNRVGKEDTLHFAGGSFIVDPDGRLLAQAPHEEDFILYAEIDLKKVANCTAKKYFLNDRRPDYYKKFSLLDQE